MKHLIIFCILIITLSHCKEKVVDEASGTFKALSYNVAGLPQLLSSSNPVKYTSLISPLLNQFDIVHVQEDFCYHDSLMLFNAHNCVTEPAPCVPEGDGLNTLTYYSIEKFERIPWIDCSGFDCLTPKGFSFSRIELHQDVSIDFYNVHCNAGGSEESKTARRGNLNQLINFIKVYSTNEPIIIMGDFNSRYSREGDDIRAFLELGFTDCWLSLIRSSDIPTLGTTSLKDCTPVNTSSDCEGVDKVFFRENEELKIEALSFQYGDDENFYYQGIDSLPLSDHSPLMVNFSYEFKRK